MTPPPDPSIPQSRLSADEFREVEAMFAELAPVSAAERHSRLLLAFADRPHLQTQLATLLAAHDSAGPPAADDALDTRCGARLGAYRIVTKIGEGGMGDVYLGERADETFVQRVAVKIARYAVRHEQLSRRFAMERQILALLHHPHVVTLLDGGVTADGHPYLVMEYVDGAPITHHCAARALSLASRLRLFGTVCSAVQHAHQHGVVHRDLKPANIVIDEDGVAKVLDFGVAKLLGPEAGPGATTGGLVPAPLTPNYASPEQLRGLAVTTSADVYALGVLLYEMTTGRRPYEMEGEPLDRVLEVATHAAVPRPSSVSPLDADALPYRPSTLRGDIDAIVLKAMAKEPSERYQSVSELAADVDRFLAGEPVLARMPSAVYVLRRLAARHKPVVAVAAAALVAVAVAAGIAVWQRNAAREAQQRAERQFADTRQLANALIFKIHDAIVPLPGSTPVRRTIVNEAATYLNRLASEFDGADETLRLELASAHGRLGAILGSPQGPNLGDRQGAIRELEKSRTLLLAIPEARRGYDAVNGLVRVDRSLTGVYRAMGDAATGAERAREAVAAAEAFAKREAADERSDRILAAALFELAWISEFDTARPIWQRARVLFDRELTRRPDSPDAMRNVALVDKYMGGALDSAGQFDEARRHYESALALDERRVALNQRDPQATLDLAIALSNVAASLSWQKQFGRAAELSDRSIALRRRLAAADPEDVFARERLAQALALGAAIELQRGNLALAEEKALEARGIAAKVVAQTKGAGGQSQLARAWLNLGRIAAARNDRFRACEAFRRSQGGFVSAVGDHSDRERLELAREIATCER